MGMCVFRHASKLARTAYRLAFRNRKFAIWRVSRYPEREFILWSDPGQSAWSIPLGQRKAGHAMLEALQPGDVIVAAKFDRLFRSMRDTHNQIAELQNEGS